MEEAIDAALGTVEVRRRLGYPAHEWSDYAVGRAAARLKYFADFHSAKGWTYFTEGHEASRPPVNFLYGYAFPDSAFRSQLGGATSMLGRNESEPMLFQMVDVESLVPEGHRLRKIDAVLDLSLVTEAVAECYSSTLGRPSIDPELGVRMLLIGTLYEADLFDYIEMFYNRRRRHSHLGGVSPGAYEQASRSGP